MCTYMLHYEMTRNNVNLSNVPYTNNYVHRYVDIP